MTKRRAFKDSAEKALQKAIDEATAGIQRELVAANQKIAQLQRVLGNVASLAQGAIGEQVVALPPVFTPPAMTHVEEQPEESPGPRVALADEDNLGEGRWI